MWGCFLMSGVKILPFLKDWWKSIPIHQNYTMALKHKDSFGISENLKKIIPGVILVFDHVYEGKSLCDNDLVWISFIKKKKKIL